MAARLAIGLFCSASDGLPQPFRDAAAEFGRTCAARGFRLVYGGSARGLMGIAAHAALDRGGDVVGVMPRHLVERERAETRLADGLRATVDWYRANRTHRAGYNPSIAGGR